MQPSYQARVRNWTKECFGDAIDLHRQTRQVQLLEEVLELLQAVGLKKEIVTEMVNIVYDKEEGNVFEEAGDVMTSMAAFCTTHGLDMSLCAERALKKCVENTEKIRAKQARKPFNRRK